MAGYFFLAPILFVVFHAYVLIQVLLLGRTAAAYNEALDRVVKSPTGNATMRQRLANTLFAQIFAGAPREREGLLGWLLKMVAWLTLAIAPTFVLLTFQFKFLPYHSHLITWTIRILILLELTVVLVLWRGTLRPDRNLSLRLTLRSWLALPSALALTAFSWIAVTFPGEPHAQWTRYWQEKNERSDEFFECESESAISKVFPSFDRLSAWEVDVVNEEKLTKIQKAAADRKLGPWEGKRTRSFRGRDLNCSDLLRADLRGVDLTEAHLRSSNLHWADLEEAVLNQTELQDASLFNARLRRASLLGADLRGAHLSLARLQSADLSQARLQGAILWRAELQKAELRKAQLQGADLSGASLVGALLSETQLQVARLYRTQLQGANLDSADLSGAFIESAGLQGANLNKSGMESNKISNTYVWRAKNAVCTDAQIRGQLSDALLTALDYDKNNSRLTTIRAIPMTEDNIAKFIEESVAGIADRRSKEVAIGRLRAGIFVDPAKTDDTSVIEKVWRKCEQISHEVPTPISTKRTVAFLRSLFCDAKFHVCRNRGYCDTQINTDAIANAIFRIWISSDEDRHELSAQVARGLLNEDGSCPASKELNEEISGMLRDAVKVLSSSTGESRQK